MHWRASTRIDHDRDSGASSIIMGGAQKLTRNKPEDRAPRLGVLCLCGPALVPVMEAANRGHTNDRSDLRCLNRSRFRTILLQCQMRPRPMIIANERTQVKLETAFIENN